MNNFIESIQYSGLNSVLQETCLYVISNGKLICILYKDKATYNNLIHELDLDNYCVEFLYSYPRRPNVLHCKGKKNKEIFEKLTPFLFSLKL